MKLLRQRLAAQFEQQRTEIAELVRDHGDESLSEITVSQLYGGLRGVIGAVCDTSVVDPQRGLLIRGKPVKELAGIDAEELFILLLTGETPDAALVDELRTELDARAALPQWFAPALSALPPDTHPVVALCAALQLLQRDSRFAAAYHDAPCEQLWEPALDDALRILAVLPALAAGVGATHRGGPNTRVGAGPVPARTTDWAGRLAATLPQHSAELTDLLRLYTLAHCDHEGSNACAYACATAASTLADPYLALTAGYRALAGPIHGLAAQTCVEFIDALLERYGSVPDDAQLAAMVQARLDSRQVIPGFGHAVLRALDPRYELLHAFAAAHFPDDEGFRVADGLLRVVPPLLAATGKVANPWPNVDGISGVVLRHYGLRDYRLLTVLFATCFSLGLLAQYVIARGIGAPLLRPRSITTAELRTRFG